MTADRERTIRIDGRTLVLILSVSACLAYGYYTRVDLPQFEPRLALHHQIIAGTAPSPYRYRVLVPFAAEALTRALSAVVPARTAFLAAYLVFDLLAIAFLLAMLLAWLRTWFDREPALVGVLFVAGTMPIALQDHHLQPWSLLEAGLFAAALIAMQAKRHALLVLLVAIATLNRETGIFIPLAFLMTMETRDRPGPGGHVRWDQVVLFGGLMLVWGVVFWGLRSARGHAPHVETAVGFLLGNTTPSSLSRTLLNGSLFLGGFWVFTWLGYRRAPQFIRQLVPIAACYALTIVVWGRWYEVRLLMPLYPILVPLGLSFLYPPGEKQAIPA